MESNHVRPCPKCCKNCAAGSAICPRCGHQLEPEPVSGGIPPVALRANAFRETATAQRNSPAGIIWTGVISIALLIFSFVSFKNLLQQTVPVNERALLTRVQPGMTMNEVIEIGGRPHKSRSLFDGSVIHHEWDYHRVQITFRNGLVERIN